MLPTIPVSANSSLQNEVTIRELQQISLSFHDNIVDNLDDQTKKNLFKWMLESYIWPRLVERRPYEMLWDKLHDMARAVIKRHDLVHPTGSRFRKEQDKSAKTSKKPLYADVADTLIFDAIDRLTNINHFISFKERLPARYQKPEYFTDTHEQPGYSPIDDIYRSGNCILDWNSVNQGVFLKHNAVARQHYTYGTSIVHSDYIFKVKSTQRRAENGVGYVEVPEIHDIGVSFDPISIRKVWFDYRLPMWSMNKQACVFFYEYCHPYDLYQNIYDPVYNPNGYSETAIASVAKDTPSFLFGTQETESANRVFADRFDGASLTDFSPSKQTKLNLKWKFYIVAPLSLDGTFATDGTIPYRRFIIETYGPQLATGEQVFLRIQPDYHPDDEIPIYGSSQFPDVDEGAYSMAVGEVLESHYNQICTLLSEFMHTKAWNNDPPTTILTSSPALGRSDLNDPGAQIPVNSHQDIQRRPAFDGIGMSLETFKELKEQGQTSSKAVDAILGKAMGARTSATEASNVFQTAMSGVTTDINIFNYMIMGGYANRTWRYIGLWMPDSLVKSITGTMGFELKPKDFELRLGLKCDIGSTFIESITRQENLRYILEASRMNPAINVSEVWRLLLKEMKFTNIEKIINDGGVEYQIRRANEEAIRGYRGEQVMIAPDANHEIALRVKMAYLEDRDSVWNTSPEFAQNIQMVLTQIQMHQTFLQIQMQQQMLAQQLQLLQNTPPEPQPTAPSEKRQPSQPASEQ